MPQRISERGLRQHTCRSITLQRGDITMQGWLRFRNPLGESESGEKREQYVIVPHGYHIPWKEIKASLGIRNRTFDSWNVPLMSGDKVVLDTESGKRPYEVYLN